MAEPTPNVRQALQSAVRSPRQTADTPAHVLRYLFRRQSVRFLLECQATLRAASTFARLILLKKTVVAVGKNVSLKVTYFREKEWNGDRNQHLSVKAG